MGERMNVERQQTRRKFLSRVLGGSAAIALAGAAGCVGSAPVGATQAGAGPVEVLPRRDGLRYANVLPATVPLVRMSPAVTRSTSTSKAFE
jgi:hypothetical protein